MTSVTPATATVPTHLAASLKATDEPAAAAISHRRAAVILAMLLGLQSISTDVYLPALPMLTRELDASISQAQLTLSAMILAFGLAQMVWGPVADRVGRRPVLLSGLLLYTLASVGACCRAASIRCWSGACCKTPRWAHRWCARVPCCATCTSQPKARR